ncbi:FAS-associated death domain protein [Octopus bimaculoides]|uniref:Death domain-containing protein n=1 Tax=Octopus bimaculoides TaxID=37653 RepID=A0A0L8HBH0_OCTBM|nr:FAS-associated death domain protein [Octopus bimaculoides]|eukprot:XP_014773860.1 PREDICTED: FAS-associated death domain protein-like [Octopus bimaculoides]
MADVYNEMLEKLSSNISDNNLQAMKNHCKGTIPQSKLEDIKNGYSFFEVLEEEDKLGPFRLDFLKNTFHACKLQTFAEFVDYFEKNRKLSDKIFNSSILDDAISYVVKHIGSRDWRFLVRDLGVSETDISYIADENPRNVREQIYQCFLLWKSTQGSNATIHRLTQILNKMHRNDILEGLKKLNGQH